MAKKFNLADYVQPAASDSDTTPEIELLPWEKIHANEANFYAVDDVEELANSIAMHGLLDPVVVTKDWQHPGEWVLISGHRRHKAWGILREKDPERYARIPAIVRQFESAQLGELALIMANSASRKLTPAEISRQAERVEMLLYELKEQGYKFPPGRMRDQVAAAVKVSSSKLARLKVIREGLAPCWSQRWESGKLSEDPAYKLAQLPADVQERIFKADPDAIARGIEIVGDLMVKGSDYRCEGLTGPGCLKCTHGDAFLRHDLADPWNPCKGEKCCLTCGRAEREWNPCPRMCSKAKQRRADQNAEAKKRQEASEKREQSKLRKQIRESALRLVKAADAAGVDDKTRVYHGYGSFVTVGWLRKAASDEDLGHQWHNPLEDLDIKRVAEALHCSADYVCGLTDELRPEAEAETEAPHPPAAPAPSPEGEGGDPDNEVYMAAARLIDPDWMTGTPPGPGRYLCLVDMDRAGIPDSLHEQVLDWGPPMLSDGADAPLMIWTAYGRPVDGMFDVVGWWPLPRKWTPAQGVPEALIMKEDDDEG